MLVHRLRDTEQGFRDTPCNARERIAVTAERYRVPDGVLEIRSLQHAADCLRDRSLALRCAVKIPTVYGPEFIQSEVETVAELAFNELLDGGLVGALAGQQDRCRGGLRPLDSFGVVVRTFRRNSRPLKDLVHGIERPADRPHPHRGAVTAAVVGLRFSALARVRNELQEPGAVLAHGVVVFGSEIAVVPLCLATAQKPVCRREGQHAVVGRFDALAPEIEILGLDVVEFVNRPDGIADNRPYHFSSVLAFFGKYSPAARQM